jgi:hypothetical protein
MSLIEKLNLAAPADNEEWLACLELPDYLKLIPAGHIVPIAGPEIWIDGNGTQMSQESYISTYGIDPSEAWAAIKSYRVNAGKKDIVRVL